MKVFGLGHEKNGSTYLCNLLNANGMNVGHETYGPDGVIGFNTHEFLIKDAIFYYTRDPRKAVHSVMTFLNNSNEYEKKTKVIYNKLNVDISEIEGIDRAIACLWYWKQLGFMYNPQYIFRVDKDPLSKLETIIQKPLLIVDVDINEGVKINYDLSQASDIWLDRLEILSKELGYFD